MARGRPSFVFEMWAMTGCPARARANASSMPGQRSISGTLTASMLPVELISFQLALTEGMSEWTTSTDSSRKSSRVSGSAMRATPSSNWSASCSESAVTPELLHRMARNCPLSTLSGGPSLSRERDLEALIPWAKGGRFAVARREWRSRVRAVSALTMPALCALSIIGAAALAGPTQAGAERASGQHAAADSVGTTDDHVGRQRDVRRRADGIVHGDDDSGERPER